MVRYQIIRGYGKSIPFGTEFIFDDKANIDAETSFVFWAESFAPVLFGISWLAKGEAINPRRSEMK